MKSRIYVFLLTASLVFVAHHSSVSAAAIPYKKKVQIQPFQNPPGWVGTYNPGNLISDLLEQKLLWQENVTLVQFTDQKLQGTKDKNGNAINSSPAQVVISGEIVAYRPALPINLESTRSEKKMSDRRKFRLNLKYFKVRPGDWSLNLC